MPTGSTAAFLVVSLIQLPSVAEGEQSLALAVAFLRLQSVGREQTVRIDGRKGEF